MMGTETQFGRWKYSGGRWNNMNVILLNYALKGYNSKCYVYFTIKKECEYICDCWIIWDMWGRFSLYFTYSNNSPTLLPKQDMNIAITATQSHSKSLLQGSEKPHQVARAEGDEPQPPQVVKAPVHKANPDGSSEHQRPQDFIEKSLNQALI